MQRLVFSSGLYSCQINSFCVAHLWFLWRNFKCRGCGSCFRSKLLVWDWRSRRFLFRREVHFCGWRMCLRLWSFVLRFILFLHHGQFGAGLDGAFLGRWTDDVFWHTLTDLQQAACAASSSTCAALFGGRDDVLLFLRAFTSLGEDMLQNYMYNSTVKSQCICF